jgi:hypothetical protein
MSVIPVSAWMWSGEVADLVVDGYHADA